MLRFSGASQQILEKAIELLALWEDGDTTLDDCLDILRNSDFQAKSAVSSILFEYFRHKGFIDSSILKHAKKGRINQPMRLLLCCALTQIFFQTGIAWQSAVNIAVDYGKYKRGQAGGAFINAILRSILRDPEIDREHIPNSFPEALKKHWENQFGKEQTESIIANFASDPKLTVRARRTMLPDEIEALGAEPVKGFDGMPDQFHFYTLNKPEVFFEKQMQDSGDFYIQDPATALSLSLLDTPPEGKVLDACAAPGGKTIMLSDLSPDGKARIIAVDKSSRRIQQMNLNFKRAGLRVKTVPADARCLPFLDETFDFILADVPCSNTGVIRRRCDVPWRFNGVRLQEVVALQKEIFQYLAYKVRKGGMILYSTCSIEKEENELLIKSFLSAHKGFSLVKQASLFPSSEHDGAFAALIRRNEN